MNIAPLVPRTRSKSDDSFEKPSPIFLELTPIVPSHSQDPNIYSNSVETETCEDVPLINLSKCAMNYQTRPRNECHAVVHAQLEKIASFRCECDLDEPLYTTPIETAQTKVNCRPRLSLPTSDIISSMNPWLRFSKISGNSFSEKCYSPSSSFVHFNPNIDNFNAFSPNEFSGSLNGEQEDAKISQCNFSFSDNSCNLSTKRLSLDTLFSETNKVKCKKSVRRSLSLELGDKEKDVSFMPTGHEQDYPTLKDQCRTLPRHSNKVRFRTEFDFSEMTANHCYYINNNSSNNKTKRKSSLGVGYGPVRRAGSNIAEKVRSFNANIKRRKTLKSKAFQFEADGKVCKCDYDRPPTLPRRARKKGFRIQGRHCSLFCYVGILYIAVVELTPLAIFTLYYYCLFCSRKIQIQILLSELDISSRLIYEVVTKNSLIYVLKLL